MCYNYIAEGNYMDINKYIGNKIRELRTKRNITQEELAEFLQIRFFRVPKNMNIEK